MQEMIKPLIDVFNFNTGLYQKVLDGISEEHAAEQIKENAGPIMWIAGHQLLTRFYACKLAGIEIEPIFEDYFKRGSIFDPVVDYPGTGTLTKEWNAVSKTMIDSFERLTEQELVEKGPFPFPVKENSILNNMCLFMMHESYHLGQMNYIRVLLGYDAVLK
ncbi:MAG: DinB family protein [bacterium]|nr:DinB family protein [bacterium]